MSLVQLLARHEGHEDMGPSEPVHDHSGAVIIDYPVPGMLVIHFLLVAIAFGVVLPYGFVCKQAGSRWHLLVQLVGGVVSILAMISGHLTGIEWYNPWLVDFAALWGLACVGGTLLLQIYMPRGILSTMREVINKFHTAISLIQPLVCWVFAGLGVISYLQYCKADHLGQCLAHGIMGTAFIVYGVIMLTMLFVGGGFLKRMNRSPEYFDSWVILIWGIINTFTEHRWGQPWNHGDVQHTSMGIIWWAAGALGVYMSWDRVNDKPQRNHIPAFVIIATGYSMITHTQRYPVSTDIHLMFGVVLVLAGLSRIVEISFVIKDRMHQGKEIQSFQYLTPLLLCLSGCFFMSATEEAMEFLHSQKIMAAPYLLTISAVGFVVFFDAYFMITSYVEMTRATELPTKEGGIELRPFLHQPDEEAQAREFEISD